LQCCKGIGGYFWFCCRHHGKKRRLPGIGETDERRISEQTQFEIEFKRRTEFARRREARSLTNGIRKIHVSATARTAFRHEYFISVISQIGNKFTRLRFKNKGARRHF
jgi:hypothetical protein